MQTLIPRILAQVGEIRIMVAIFLATAGCFSLVPVTENALALGILACCFGLSTGGGQAITTNMLFTHYGRSSPAETLGLRLTFNNAIRVVTPAIMGGLISGIGIAATCGVAVTILLWGSRITYRALHMRAT